MTRIKLLLQLISNMGLRYFAYRITHELEKKLKLVKKKHPVKPPLKRFISLQELRSTDNLVIGADQGEMPKNPSPALEEKAKRILKGEIRFFNNEWKTLGLDYDWITNPDSGFRYDSKKHWSEIQDFSASSGDIKFVWEKSRFSYLLTIMRYDFQFKEDHAKFVFEEIESWIDANPINQGPNWKCSQEISLRIFNWCFVLDYYRNSPELTEARWNKILHVIYWSLHHVYKNINFSRIAVRNNHAITETLFLALSELMFPFFPESKQWATVGRKWFEQEVDYQVYDDGTYLQFSMNYHRVVIQLLSLGIAVSEKHGNPFSGKVYEKAYRSLDFLYQCLQEENGYLPNYGSNDGALFFPLSDQDYRDYRPQLNHLHFILTGKQLYPDGPEIAEDAFWVQPPLPGRLKMAPLSKKYGALSFPIGGFYLVRQPESFTMIRCGKHKDRPHQADNLHLDVWIKGENVLRDSGTYKYNTDKVFSDYFTGTLSHNTVSIGEKSQMLKGSRFIWYFWSQALEASLSEKEDYVEFKGSVSCFRHIKGNTLHQRSVRISKAKLLWTVEDSLNAPGARQNWHFGSKRKVSLTARSKGENLEAKRFVSYESSYYGSKTETESLYFDFDQNITTEIDFNA